MSAAEGPTDERKNLLLSLPSPRGVAAVIVSYNRRALLEQVVDAVEAQTTPVSRIIVIDNGSTDGSREFLRERGDRVDLIEAGTNGGGAGGFATGLAWALAVGSSYVWLMDDDAVPERDCLELLLEAADSVPHAPYVAPVIVDGEGNLADRSQPRWDGDDGDHVAAALRGYASIGSCSFVGPLIRADAALATHLPYREFFIWHDDMEYTARLSARGRGVAVPRARIAHLTRIRGSQSFVPHRARYDIRNLAWCVRVSRPSILSWRTWLVSLTIAIRVQFPGTPARQWPRVVAVTVAALGEALRSRPRNVGVAETIDWSRRHDVVSPALRAAAISQL